MLRSRQLLFLLHVYSGSGEIMNQLNEKILNIIDGRINDVIDWLQSCNSLEEKYELTRDAINYIEGILSMKEDNGDDSPKTYDEQHKRLTNEVISALDELKRKYPNTQITIEAPNNGTCCILGDANIYLGLGNAIIIDAE